jgi:Kdo2-lipid IVA lauroyltransferase/acyltransferase
VAELPRLWLGQPVPVRMTGSEHIDAALDAGQGILFLTPHMGWMSDQAPDSMQRKGIEQVVRVLKGERPTAVVNPEVLNLK